ncbi:MAG: DUF4956 domain-containing protein [Myxococcota bacterium]|nr:DUF4956 domain-containing protein [Myxococcota bacterium]
MSEILGLHPEFVVADNLFRLLGRMFLDLIFTLLVVFGVYVRRYSKNHYVFTYIIFNIITFTLCFLLRQVPIELGFALGLFAVFGILRYRTEAIHTRDLTYLFVVIGLGILNAVASQGISLSELLTVNLSIVILTAVLELNPKSQDKKQLPMTYDNMEILKQNDPESLIKDLKERTGLPVINVHIQRIDLLKDTADIVVDYQVKKGEQ